MEVTNIPVLLAEAIQKDNLVIFAGSGLSIRFGLPNWRKLVTDVIDIVNNESYKPYSMLLNTEGEAMMSPLEVLDKLKGEHIIFREYIRDHFEIKTGDFTLHKKIIELTGKVITTNYDNAFEKACNGNIKPTYPTSRFNISELEKNKDRYIFNIHGSYHEADNCILFKSDYERMYGTDSAVSEKLKSIFINKTILFIGFSFNDPDLNLIFSNLNQHFSNFNKHFILTPSSNFSNKHQFLEEINIEFDHFNKYFDSLIKIKQDKNKAIDLKRPYLYNNVLVPKIALLFPQCLDRSTSNMLGVAKHFESLNIELYTGVLNKKTLSNLYEYDTLIIISEVFKNKIYFEEDNIKSNLISAEELVEYIPNDDMPIIFITDEIISPIKNRDAIYIGSFKKQTINKFIYKTFRKNELNSTDESVAFYLSHLFTRSIESGLAIKKAISGNNRNLEIGKKALTSVIGRIEEQSAIIQRVLAIINSNKLLNIKASGGIGKTTLIKKVAYELYNRGYFKEGVNFKSCESVKTFSDFEELLYDGFNLNNIINFKEHLIQNYSNSKIDLLIILDNFETIINVLSSSELDDTIELLKFATDYANIIITSRDRIGTDEFEDVYSLTPMTTDDALILFQKDYGEVKDSEEIRILRSDILEDLLNNNPLAIKLVTNSRTRFKHITELRSQLQEQFFESINEDFSNVFKSNADLNIERTRSIYQSINYSYTTLKSLEKVAFEILSLFPDGISLSNFKKCFSQSTSSNKISDKELRILRDKSLVEDYNGTLQLQPIIRRFADYQFQKQPIAKKQKFCSDAYSYNCSVFEVIETIDRSKSYSEALRFYTNFKNNMMKVLEYIPVIEISAKGVVDEKKYLLNYIYDLRRYVLSTKQVDVFINKLESLQTFFDDIPFSDKLIDTIINSKLYFNNEFDTSYEKLCGYLSVEEMSARNIENEDYIETRYKNIIASIHNMEGYTLQYLTSHIQNSYNEIFSDSMLFYLGIPHDPLNERIDFYTFEYALMNNLLDIDKLDLYISSLYMEEHLEAMQCTYTLSKVKAVDRKTIKKLVVTNPYTRGLKELMFAFNTKDVEQKEKHFKNALKFLEHIKYYYLEALYYYCTFLKETNQELYIASINEGLYASKQYHYQYLQFLFENIENQNKPQYLFSFDYYSTEGIAEYINEYTNSWKNIFTRN